MYKIIFIFLFVILIETSFPQSYHSSIIFESACLISQTKDLYAIDNPEYLYGFSLSLGNIFSFSNNYQIEVRPGYFFSDMYFQGLQLGLLLGKRIDNKILCSIGVTTNLNLFMDSGHHNQPKSFSFMASLGLKIKHSDNFSTTISVYKTLDNLYGYGYKDLSNPMLGEVYFSKRLFWIFRIGVEYEL